jgi:hypothetical protein
MRVENLHTDTRQFLDELGAFVGRPLSFPLEVGLLLDLARKHRLDQTFRDAIFHAKFAVKTKDIMGRIGTDGEGFDKLSTEFQNSVEKTSALLKTIVKESPEEIKHRFANDFFSLDQTSFANFTRLLEDLSWVKNWDVDGKAMPLENTSSGERTGRDVSGRESGRVRKSAILGLILMIILLIIDPPVSYLGWSAAIIVDVLLLYIALAARTTKET